jgi:hypothetical protein
VAPARRKGAVAFALGLLLVPGEGLTPIKWMTPIEIANSKKPQVLRLRCASLRMTDCGMKSGRETVLSGPWVHGMEQPAMGCRDVLVREHRQSAKKSHGLNDFLLESCRFQVPYEPQIFFSIAIAQIACGLVISERIEYRKFH